MSYKKRKDPNGLNQITTISNQNNLLSNKLIKQIIKLHEVQNPSENQVMECNKLTKEVINNILKNKVEIIKLFKKINDRNLKFRLFQYNILLPYFIIGNKYMERFEEFYEFISEFKLHSFQSKFISLFRCMEESEYELLLNGGEVISPSYSENPQKIVFLKNSTTLVNINKKNVFVCCGFSTEDIISGIEITMENEVLIRKGSKPLFIYKFSEYGKEQLEEDLGKDVYNYLPLKPSEIGNGFNYMESLKKKGFIYNRPYVMNGNQMINTDRSKFIEDFTLGVNQVTTYVKQQHPEFILSILRNLN